MTRIILLVSLAALFLLALWLWTPDKSRTELVQKYPGALGDDVEVAGIHLNVRHDGPKDRPAVVFLHGLGSSLQTWDDVSAALVADGFRTIRIDLPGFGLTGADPTGDYSDARSATLLTGLMDELGVARATFVGNSLGGRLAWQFASGHPGRVERLILISPDGFASPGFAYGKAPDVPFLLKLLPYVLPKFMLRMQLTPAYADPTVLSDALVDRYYDMMRAPGVRRALLDRTAQTVLQPPEPLLAKITAPTLLIWGEKDALIPFSNSADYLKLIAGSRLEPLPNVGHLPQEESPALTARLIAAFLKP
jgi:pimeloyl-ACP methyl ester carboxylesterase